MNVLHFSVDFVAKLLAAKILVVKFNLPRSSACTRFISRGSVGQGASAEAAASSSQGELRAGLSRVSVFRSLNFTLTENDSVAGRATEQTEAGFRSAGTESCC